MIRIYDRQGRFQGDISLFQNELLSWLMSDEMKREAEQKRLDYEMFALAANEHTNPTLLEHLQKPDEPGEEEIEWLTPKSDEEVNELLSMFGGAMRAGRKA